MQGADSDAREVQRIVGAELMERLCKAMGGNRVYIPHVPPGRKRKIAADFDAALPGAGTVEVAYEIVASTHGISPRTVQRAVLGR